MFCDFAAFPYLLVLVAASQGHRIQHSTVQIILTQSIQEFLKATKLDIFQWPNQPPDLNPTEHASQLLNTELKAERPRNEQQLSEGLAFGDVFGFIDSQLTLSLIKRYIFF